MSTCKAAGASGDEKTTIQITVGTQRMLNKLRRGRDTYNDIIQRLALGTTDVYVEFILVDNELPHSHTAIIQVGEDARNLFYWNGGKIQPISVEDTQKLLKRPKPNMTITKKEAGVLHNYILAAKTSKLEKLPEWNPQELNKVFDRLSTFFGA